MKKEDNKKQMIILFGGLGGLLAALVGVAYLYGSPTGNDQPTAATASSHVAGDRVALGELGNDQDYGEAYQQKITQTLEKRLSEFQESQQKQQTQAMEMLQKQAESYQQQINQQAASQQALIQQQSSMQTGPSVQAAPAERGESIEVKGEGGKEKENALDAQFTSTPQDIMRDAEEAVQSAKPAAKVEAPRKTPAIPANGWVNGVMLNGMVAKAGDTQEFTTITLTGSYKSANGYTSTLQKCIVVGQGSADLPGGRVQIKPVKMTCNLPGGRSQSWDVGGYVVDADDGIKGVRGTIVDNMGNKITGSALTAAIGAVGRVVNQNQMTTTYSGANGSGASLLTGDPKQALLGGALAGASGGTEKELAEYYKLFTPSVQVGGGRKVTVFIATEQMLPAEGKSLTRTYTDKNS